MCYVILKLIKEIWGGDSVLELNERDILTDIIVQ